MIIEPRPSSSGQKNTLVITGAAISSLTERILPCRKPNGQNAMRKPGSSRLLWVGSSSGPSDRDNETMNGRVPGARPDLPWPSLNDDPVC